MIVLVSIETSEVLGRFFDLSIDVLLEFNAWFRYCEVSHVLCDQLIVFAKVTGFGD